MKFFKVLSLSTFVFLANCSFLDDKFFSESKDKPEENNEQQEIVTEKAYEDEKPIVKDLEKSSNEDFLAGDIQEEDYPNLANVPQRPDEPVSIEEQKKIIKDLKDENIENLDSIKSFSIEEKNLLESEVTKFNEINEENKLKNNLERTKSIRDIQNQKLVEYKSYKPKLSNNKAYVRDEEEEDLHKLVESLKNITSEDDVIKLEEKIQKKDLNYSPTEIANILGVRGLDDSPMDSFKTHELKTKKQSEKQVHKIEPSRGREAPRRGARPAVHRNRAIRSRKCQGLQGPQAQGRGQVSRAHQDAEEHQTHPEDRLPGPALQDVPRTAFYQRGAHNHPDHHEGGRLALLREPEMGRPRRNLARLRHRCRNREAGRGA